MVTSPEQSIQIPLTDLALPLEVQAMTKAPRILRSVPYYQIKPILEGDFDTSLISEGIYASVFKIDLKLNYPLSLKLFHQTPIPKVDLLNFMLKARGKPQLTLTDPHALEETHPTELSHMILLRTVESQAAAHLIGHGTRPDLVDDLHAVFAYDGVPVGFTRRYIEGTPITLEQAIQETGDRLITALKELEEVDVLRDRSEYALNAIKTPDNLIKLIDLDYEIRRRRVN